MGNILVKDESHRFGLKAFKALGASYAVYRWIKESDPSEVTSAHTFYRRTDRLSPESVTFTTATDGNHGRGVAWVARKLGQRAVVYMPRGSAKARIEAIKSEGAEVVVVDGDYDCAVRRCAHEAAKYGRPIIADIAWPGYETIPRWIQDGYLTLFDELHDEVPVGEVDLVLIPAGVGALAAAAAAYYCRLYSGKRPALVSVEPTGADCLQQSLAGADGVPVVATGPLESIMAGLNCGTLSDAAWPIIRDTYTAALTIGDSWSRHAMSTYWRPRKGDPQVVSGESGAAALGGLLALCRDQGLAEARERLPLSRSTTVLVLNTEGDTDPESFRQIVNADDSLKQ